MIELKMKAKGRLGLAAINYWVFPRTALIDVKLASVPSALGPLSNGCLAKKFSKREKKRERERDWLERFHSPKTTRKDLKEEVMRSAAE